MNGLNRQPSGQPIGGQFAAGTRSESTVPLAEPASPQPTSLAVVKPSTVGTAEDRGPAPALSARQIAEAAVDRLFVEDPAAGYKLYRRMLSKVRDAEYPRLKFEIVPDPNYPDDPDAAVPTFIDPYTGDETGIRVVDRAVRETEDEAIEADPEGQAISVDYGGGDDGNGFETLIYVSTSTGKPVRLPEGWEEQ